MQSHHATDMILRIGDRVMIRQLIGIKGTKIIVKSETGHCLMYKFNSKIDDDMCNRSSN